MKPYKGVYLSKYAILISEDNLDLIEKLNDGVRPKMEEKTTYFITETDTSKKTPNEIKFEDDLYTDGYADPDINFLM